MMKLKTLALLPLLALCACGQFERQKVDMKKVSQAIQQTNAAGAGGDPVLNKLAQDCRAQNGRLNADGDVCMLKEKQVTLVDAKSVGQVSEIEVDSAFLTGKFLVATAGSGSAQGAVDILYNGRPFSAIPARMMANLQNLPAPGRLSVYLNNTNFKDVTVIVWSCFQRTIQNRILCPAAMIP